MKEKKFSLAGVDGNAYSIMGYTARALRKVGLIDEIHEMYEEATGGDYYNLIAVCDRYIDMANDMMDERL
jgi:hypothetical protein